MNEALDTMPGLLAGFGRGTLDVSTLIHMFYMAKLKKDD
jgi:hypothetical protein